VEESNLAIASKKGLRLKTTFGFLDETGFSDKPFVCYTWAKRGHTPILLSTGGWKHRTLVGTVLCRPDGTRARLVFTIQKKAMRARTFIRYLRKLKAHQRGRHLTLFLDGLPAHRAKLVGGWVAANTQWLEVHRFPAYAPELNPAEYVWSAVKRKDLGNRIAQTMTALERRLRQAMHRVAETAVLRGCLKRSGLY
jgi:transposase